MSSTISTQQFLSFHLNSEMQAMLPTQQLAEILNLSISQIVPIPDVPPQIVGVCNWRGEVLWLADLGYLLNLKPILHSEYRQSSYSVIILQHKGNSLGLLVDRVDGMILCHRNHIQPLPASQQSLQSSPYIQGCWLNAGGKTVLALDPVAIVSALSVQS